MEGSERSTRGGEPNAINIHKSCYFMRWSSQPRRDNRERILLFGSVGLRRVARGSRGEKTAGQGGQATFRPHSQEMPGGSREDAQHVTFARVPLRNVFDHKGKNWTTRGLRVSFARCCCFFHCPVFDKITAATGAFLSPVQEERRRPVRGRKPGLPAPRPPAPSIDQSEVRHQPLTAGERFKCSALLIAALKTIILLIKEKKGMGQTNWVSH